MINTQYIETDSLSFKSVVQRLTGKDAIVEVEEPPFIQISTVSCEVAQSDSVLLEINLLKDFDMFLMGLPSAFDNMYQIITD